MIKKYKIPLIIASLMILSPIVFAVIEQKLFYAVISAVMLSVFWICVAFTAKDSANETQNRKIMLLAFCIVPVITLFATLMIYLLSKGIYIAPTAPLVFIMAPMFIFIGNYMPKCTRNHTMGIKIKHTLENEENWNATHRFAGKVWFIGGLVVLFGFFLPDDLFFCVILPLVMVFVFAPVVYSYVYYKKQVKNGSYTVDKLAPFSSYEKTNKRMKIFTAIFIPVILVGCAVLMFTGEVTAVYEDETLTLDSTYWAKTTLALDGIDTVELYEGDDFGYRVSGFGSPRLLAGNAYSDTFGNYISYRYTSQDVAVVIKTEDTAYVVALSDTTQTEKLYNDILGGLE